MTGSALTLRAAGGSSATGVSLSANTDYVLAICITSNLFTLWINGVKVYSYNPFASTPSWGTTPQFFIGTLPDSSGYTPNGQYSFGAFYNRAITLQDAAAWATNPWQIMRPTQSVAALATSGGIVASPTTIYSVNSSGQTINLSGLATSWSSGSTTFSVSGVAGVTKTAQTVTSTTAGTITLDTRSSTGSLAITDGQWTTHVTVAPPSVTASPAAIPINHSNPITLTLAGFGTSWGGGTTFSVSGVAGVTQVSQNVASTTAATVVVETGGTSGTLAITDGTATVNVPVEATTFTLSPASGIYTAPVSITATGSAGSVWTQETASTLFTTPGTHGDSISTIAVHSDTSATFTLNPGTATGSLTVTQTPGGSTRSYTINGVPGSLRVTGQWNVQTASSTLLASQPTISISFFIQYNTIPATGNRLIDTTNQSAIVNITTSGKASYPVYGTSGGVGSYNATIVTGQVYHVAVTWNQSLNRRRIYVDGSLVSSGLAATAYGSSTSQWLQVGSELVGSGSSNVDYQIANLAIWQGYELTGTDVAGLCNAIYTPGNLIGSASGIAQPPTSWWLLGDATSGTPSVTDYSFTDIGSSAAHSFSTFSSGAGTASNASYAAPLVYVSPITITPCVTRSGQLAVFFATATNSATTAIGGTVSVSRGSAALTTSVVQPPVVAPPALPLVWINSQLQITGDSSNTTYTITGGSGKTWTISPAYAGSTNAVGASATLIQAGTPSVITSITSYPTIKVQFGGMGSPKAVQIWGPVWSPVSQVLPYAAWLLQCGPVQSLVIQNPGANYTSPSVSATGGGGTGLTFGTPVLSGGVTSFTKGSGGSGYTSAPTVTIAAPSLAITGTLTSGSAVITSVSSTAGIVPGMAILGTGTYPNFVASVGSGTITLISPAVVLTGTAPPVAINGTVSAGATLAVVGKQAMATATISGGAVTGLNVFVPGAGYSGTIAVTLTGGGGTGASFTGNVSSVIVSIPVTNGGSGYTSPPTITITDMAGSGAVASPVMGGVQASDVVTYSAGISWLTTGSGAASGATNGSVGNYAGELEPGLGGCYDFGLSPDARTLPIGMNTGDAVAQWGANQPVSNWLTRAPIATNPSGPIVTVTPDGRPETIIATSGSPVVLLISDLDKNNGIDSSDLFPIPIANGVNGNLWTFIADELNPSQPLTVAMTCQGATVTGGLVSGGTSTTGVTGLTLTSGGSGFTDVPTVTITGNGTGATGYALVNARGQVYWVGLLACGAGYSGSVMVTISGNGGTGATATATTGNVYRRRTWQWAVVPTTTSNKIPYLALYNPVGVGTYNYTLTNECLFSPLSTAAAYPSMPTRATALTIEPSNAAWLTTPSAKYPSVIRCMSSEMVYALSNVVDACDLKNPAEYTWNTRPVVPGYLTSNPTGPRTINMTAIRTYAVSTSGYPAGWNVTWSNPHVYIPYQGAGTVTASTGWNGYGASNTDGGPYYVSPADPGWINMFGAASKYYCAEFVTSVPHNLKTGQYISIGGSGAFSVGDGTNTYSLTGSNIAGGTPVVYVTSPTTFVCLFSPYNFSPGVPSGLPGNINHVAGTFSVSFMATIVIPDLQSTPHETCAAYAGSFPGCNLWTNIPWAATDACVTAIANRILQAFPPGRKVYVEYANEPWNAPLRPTGLYCFSMGSLGVWSNISGLTSIQAYTIRASQVQTVFKNAFAVAGRGSEVVNVFGSQYTNTSQTTTILGTSSSIEIDAIAVAPYQDTVADVTSPTTAASVASSSGSTGLSAGTYYGYYTWVDAVSGIETSVGASQCSFTVSSGNTYTMTIPAFPTWGSVTANIYLTPANGARRNRDSIHNRCKQHDKTLI